jgi:hypothetical protein
MSSRKGIGVYTPTGTHMADGIPTISLSSAAVEVVP